MFSNCTFYRISSNRCVMFVTGMNRGFCNDYWHVDLVSFQSVAEPLLSALLWIPHWIIASSAWMLYQTLTLSCHQHFLCKVDVREMWCWYLTNERIKANRSAFHGTASRYVNVTVRLAICEGLAPYMETTRLECDLIWITFQNGTKINYKYFGEVGIQVGNG